MSLVTLREILAPCRKEGWAVPAFDVMNQETILAALGGAAAERSPVILMIYPNHTPAAQWPGLTALIEVEARQAGVPVCLQLDHSTNLDLVQAALDAGFSSVMIDGSTLPLAGNIAFTRQAVQMARARGASVEAELGHVGQGDEVLAEEEATKRMTRPEDAGRFVDETGVDALAVAIGTAHGLYRGRAKLDFERLEALRQAVAIPLVLHGGTGVSDEQMQHAIARGVCKVNIWTEVALAFGTALQEQLTASAGRVRLPETMAAARQSAQQVVQQKIRVLGSAGRVA